MFSTSINIPFSIKLIDRKNEEIEKLENIIMELGQRNDSDEIEIKIMIAQKMDELEGLRFTKNGFEEDLRIGNFLFPLGDKFKKYQFSKKLEVWDEAKIPLECYDFSVSKDTGNSLFEEPHKGSFFKFRLEPQTPEECQQYYDWFTRNLKIKYPKLYDFETLKTDFFAQIKGNPYKLEFAKKKLADHKLVVNNLVEKSGKLMEGFKVGFQSVFENEEIDFTKIKFNIWIYSIADIQKGIIYAHFIKFLEQKIKELERDETWQNHDETEITPSEIQQCVVWLHSIGVIDFIREKHKVESSTTIAKILAQGMTKPDGLRNELWDTIRKAIDRISDDSTLQGKYDSFINATCHKLKISRVK
jgi:hypothetical protein